MLEKFQKALLEGIANATNAEKFIDDIKALLENCNSEINKIKINPSDTLEFKFENGAYNSFLNMTKQNDVDNFSGTIYFVVNDEKHKSILVNNFGGSQYRIKYNKTETTLNFPNIEEFEEIFRDYIKSSKFGELIYYHVKIN